MSQDVRSPPNITIDKHELDVVHDFVYISSTISDTLSLDSELNRRIGNEATSTPVLPRKIRRSRSTEHVVVRQRVLGS